MGTQFLSSRSHHAIDELVAIQWSITVKLPPGAYEYKYVVDSKWTQDPYGPMDAPDGFGGRNSKFEVK